MSIQSAKAQLEKAKRALSEARTTERLARKELFDKKRKPFRDTLYMVLGENICKARVKKGLTQEDLSVCVGLSRTSIANIEAGRQAMLLDTLYFFAEVLGTTTAALLPKMKEGK